MIRVVSKRANGVQPMAGEVVVDIDRGTPLGNPYAMRDEADRPRVIAAYSEWLRAEYRKRGAVRLELHRLADLHNAGTRLALRCWCAPKACHGDFVKLAVERISQGAA